LPQEIHMLAEAAPNAPETWAPLNPIERRVLGVLVEKAKTTPDIYPLSLNALTTGCNQKHNRDPVMNLVEAEVQEAVDVLKKRGLVQQVLGSGRVDRYRHVLYEAWKVDKVELAILGELLLRGAQTEGELRTRASRMELIADLEALRKLLAVLVDRGLVVYLTPADRRGAVVTHGFHAAEELDRLRFQAAGEAKVAPEAPSVFRQVAESEIAALRAAVEDLQRRVARLEAGAAPLSNQSGPLP